MTEELALRAMVTLGDWTLKATTILCVAWVVTSLFRKSAATRHLTWATALGVLLLLPVFTAFVPSSPSVITIHSPSARVAIDAAVSTIDSLSEGSSSASIDWTWVPIAVLSVWIVGAAAVGLHGVLGMLAVAVLRRRSVERVCDSFDPAAIAARVGLKRRWELRTSSTASPSTAMTWGLLHPIVLLPRESASWPRERLETVLLHELAHVRRCDSLSQALSLVVCALHWFNPAVWLCARAMRAEAETAADDTVLSSGVKPSEYAAELLRFTAELARRRQLRSNVAVSIAGQTEIETRIRSIVDPARCRRGVCVAEGLTATAAGLFAVLLFVSFNHVGFAAGDRQAADVSPVLADRGAPSQEAGKADDVVLVARKGESQRRRKGSTRVAATGFTRSEDAVTRGEAATEQSDVLANDAIRQPPADTDLAKASADRAIFRRKPQAEGSADVISADDRRRLRRSGTEQADMPQQVTKSADAQ